MGDVRLVIYGAAWCGPCRMFDPVLDDLAEKYPGLQQLHVDVDEHPDEAMRSEIRSMPTTVVHRDGREVGRIVGARPLRVLEKSLHEILGES